MPTVQFGRGLAAALVLLYHITNAMFAGTAERYVFNGGAAGVDVFFVISGFIITYVSRGDSASRFFVKRAIRIAPLYWFYTTVVIAILLVAPSLYANLRFTFSFAAASYLFILSPSNTGAPGVAVGVGWTLAYEAYFYVLMAIGIRLFADRGWLAAAAVILAGAAVSPFVDPPAPLTPMLTALPLEFLAGVLLAQWYVRGGRLPRAAAVAALILGLAGIVYAGATGRVDGVDASRVFWYGVPATAIVAGLISLHGRMTVPGSARWLGDVSYSLYLSHPFVIEAVIRVARYLALPDVVIGPLLVAAALVAAALSYRLIEKPSTRYLSHAFRVRDPLPEARSA